MSVAATIVVAVALVLLLAACAPERKSPVTRVADGRVVETYDSLFVAEVVAPKRPSVVYFHALGCMPCAALAPHLPSLARRFAGRVTFWSLDWGWSAARYYRYDVQVVPTLVFYVGGREIDRLEGAPPKDLDRRLAAWVERSLAKADSLLAAGH